MPSLSEGGGSLLCRAQMRRRELYLGVRTINPGLLHGEPRDQVTPINPFSLTQLGEG